MHGTQRERVECVYFFFTFLILVPGVALNLLVNLLNFVFCMVRLISFFVFFWVLGVVVLFFIFVF